jgi:hypothetical protein
MFGLVTFALAKVSVTLYGRLHGVVAIDVDVATWRGCCDMCDEM